MLEMWARDAKLPGQRGKQATGWKRVARGVAAGGVALFVLGTSAPAFADGGSSSDTNADVNASVQGVQIHLGAASAGDPALPPAPALPPQNVDGLVGTLGGPFGTATSTANRFLNPFGIGVDGTLANGPSGGGDGGAGGNTGTIGGATSPDTNGGGSPTASLDAQRAVTHGVDGTSTVDAEVGMQSASVPESTTLASAAGARDANAQAGGLSWEIVGIAAGALGVAAGANIYVVRRVRQAR